jgi:peptidoglycan L-alanyl-D-glutamate endopeptidase CwlK
MDQTTEKKKPGRIATAVATVRDGAKKIVSAVKEKVKVALDNMAELANWFTASSIKKLETVNPILAAVLPRAKQIFLSMVKGADVQVTQGVRTAKEQNDLYQQGRTKPGPIVTHADGYKGKSNHQSPVEGQPGQAVDFAISVNGRYVDDGHDPLYKKFNDCVKQAEAELGYSGIKWGGTWAGSKFDGDHLECQDASSTGGSKFAQDKKTGSSFVKKHPVKKPAAPQSELVNAFLKPTQNALQSAAPAWMKSSY